MKSIRAFLLSSALVFCAQSKAIPESIQEQINQGHLTQALDALKQEPVVTYASKIDVDTTIAKIYRLQSRYQDALDILDSLSHRPNIPLETAFEIATEKGISARNISKNLVALDAYKEALEIAKTLRDDELIAKTYINLGVLSENSTNLSTSMGYYEQAKTYLQNSTNWALKGSLEFNIAAINERMGDFEQAKAYLTRALEYDRRSGNLTNVGFTTLKLAVMVARQGEPSEGLIELTKAIEELKQIQANELVSRAYYALADVYKKLNLNTERRDAALHSLEFALLTQSRIQQSHGYLAVIESELEANNVDAAKGYLKPYEHLVKETKSPHHQYMLMKVNAQIAELEGKFEAATLTYKTLLDTQYQTFEEKLKTQSQNHKSSLDMLSKQQQVVELDRDRKLTISQLENAKLQQQRWLLAFGLTFIFVCTFIYLYVHKRRSAELRAQLYEANIRQKDQLLADISHELRTPLSVLKLHIEAMEHNLIDDKTVAYEKINDKISQLNHLISDVYQLSQAENNALTVYNEKYNVHQLMTSYSYDMQRMISKHNLRFVCDIAVARDISMYVDKPKLDRIINNLTKNACLYTDSPGLVRFKVRLNPQYVFIQIDDSSPGVTNDQLSKLFERLYRVDTSRSRASGGSGLGLSICQSLAQVMQGKIDLKQGKYGGLCVKLLLPYEYKAN
ncbi:ATP-binding protein [Pseudoalteromonas xiamenensis]